MNKLACIIPFYKRHDLTELCFKSIKRQSKKYNIEVFTVGSEGEESKKLSCKYGFNYLEFENERLGAKNNAVLRETRKLEFDGVFILGSDNFVNDAIIEKLLSLDLKGKKIYGFTDIHFYDTQTRELKSEGTYTLNKMTIGVARLFSRELLEAMSYTLWPNNYNSGLDTASIKRIRNHAKETPIEYDSKYFMLDVKHSNNITSPSIMKTCEREDEISLIEKHLKSIGKEILNLKSSNDTRKINNTKIMASKNYIKFIKEHPAGIPKGKVIGVNGKLYHKFINDEYAVASNLKEYQEYNRSESQEKKEASQNREEAKKQAIEKKKAIEEKKANQKMYRALDELDLEANTNLSDQGLKLGDMVEVDAKANIVYNDKGEASKRMEEKAKETASKAAPKTKKKAAAKKK